MISLYIGYLLFGVIRYVYRMVGVINMLSFFGFNIFLLYCYLFNFIGGRMYCLGGDIG